MHTHLRSLQQKHEHLESKIHEESLHPSRDDLKLKRWKKEKLLLQEEIDKLQSKQANRH